MRNRKVIMQFFKDADFKIGFILLLFVLFLSVHGQFFIPESYVRVGAFKPSQPPQGLNFLGTDSFGRDVYAQLSYSITNSLIIGIMVAIVGTIVGSVIGFISGYYGGTIDAVVRIIINVMLSIPSLLLLLLIASFVKGALDFVSVSLIISLFSWAWPARQVRSQVLSLKEREFVNVAKLSGMKGYEIIFIEIMPHMFRWMSVHFISTILYGILTESSLSVLGLGPQRNLTLGMMIYWALNYAALYRGMWWWWATPVITLIVLFLSLYLMNIGLEKIMNPRLQRVG
jgi:peptide/nickel transport system permease protein